MFFIPDLKSKAYRVDWWHFANEFWLWLHRLLSRCSLLQDVFFVKFWTNVPNQASASSFSGEEEQGVALWNINGIGAEILQLHLGILKVLEVDGDANAGVASDNIVLAPGIVDVGGCDHLVFRILVLSRVDDSVRALMLATHFLF